MPDLQTTIDLRELRKKLGNWLQSRLNSDKIHWLNEQSQQLIDDAEDWVFFTTFSAAPRHTGKDPLSPTADEKQEAEKIRPGWTPDHWSTDQLARTLLVLSIAEEDKETFLELLDKTFKTSDVGEAIALYQSLPLLPHPKNLQKRAAEGIRSNMTSVFNAVALRNPYPADYFDDDAWNQVVLKALFVESPLFLIQGIERRANEELAHMLVDYAHERWAANRSVSPELWRPVGPFADEAIVDDLGKVLEHRDKMHQYAAILSLSESPSPTAKELVEKHRKLYDEIRQKNISWDVIGREVNNQHQI